MGMNGKLVVVWMMDIGGDKLFDYMLLLKEENLFLGYWVIWICLDWLEFFKI